MHHQYGLALFKPVPSEFMRPGSVGLFDANGNWNLIASLDDPDSLADTGLRAPATEIEKMPRDEASSLEPKVSYGVVQEAGNFSDCPG